MARSNGLGRRIIGMEAEGKKGAAVENNSADNTKQIAGTTYRIRWPDIIEPLVRPAVLRVFGISNNTHTPWHNLSMIEIVIYVQRQVQSRAAHQSFR